MSRELIFSHDDWGSYEALIIFEDEHGQWSGEWSALQKEDLEPVTSLFSRVGRYSYEDALAKHTLPFIRELDLPPEACLIRTDEAMLHCAYRDTCSMYNEDICWGDDKNVPPCFGPTVPEETNVEAQALLGRIIEMWRNDQWVVIVEHENKE